MDLEDELKRLFQDDRLDVQVAADAEKIVVAGARRTYRRRTALISAAGVLSAAVLATGTVTLTGGPEQSTVADRPSLSITTGPSSVVPSGLPPGTEAPAKPNSAPTSVSSPGVGDPPTITKSTVKGPTASPSHPPASSVTATLIGSQSYGPFTLGMSDADVQALIQANGVKTSAGCSVYQIPGQNGSQLVVSPTKGLVTIAPVASKLTTPQGVGIGSTPEQVKAKYPDYVDGANPAKVSAGSDDFYYFSMSAGSAAKVTGIKLVRGDNC
jgi:hypothetical protein